MRDFETEERINRALRARRRAEIRRRRRRRARIKRALVLSGMAACLLLVILGGVGIIKAVTGRKTQAAEQTADAGKEDTVKGKGTEKKGSIAGILASSDRMQELGEQLQTALQAVQEMDMLGAGGPQQRLLEAVAGSPVGYKAAQAPPFQTKEGAVALLHMEQQRGEDVGGHIGPHAAPLWTDITPVRAGRGKIEDLGVLEPGDQLLGPAGRGAPGLVGQAEDLLHGESLLAIRGYNVTNV